MINIRNFMIIVFKLWNIFYAKITYNVLSKKLVTINKASCPLRAGFEPTRENPIGFQVQRLNHSAIAAVKSQRKKKY